MTGALSWDRFGRYIAALFACALIGWLSFGKGVQVPILGLFDFGIHELGHLLTFLAPPMIMFLAGSTLQIGVPLGLALYFAFRRRDPVASAVTLAWAGSAARDVSVYIADAPFERLPLAFPGSQHDWAWLLSPRGFDAMDSAATIALTVKVCGAALLFGAIVMVFVLAIREQLGLEAAPGEVRRNLTIRRPRRWAAPPSVEPAPTAHGGSP